MIITVMYRDTFSKYFKTGPYTYKCNLPVEEGDVVIVPTKFGISLAQVHKINQVLIDQTQEMKLLNVLEVCKTKYPLPEA